MKLYQFDSPVGVICYEVNEDQSLVSLEFRERPGAIAPPDSDLVADELGEYFLGMRRSFTLKLAPKGTQFQQDVWHRLVEIPFGSTTTYGSMAKEMGRPLAARAVGRANATNPIALVIPCHRVIGSSGDLTGFAYGVSIKRWLLDFESAGAPSELGGLFGSE